MKKIIFSIFVFSFLLSSCNKNENKCDLSAANLAGSTYKITAVFYKANAATPTEDEFANMDACDKDNLVIFNANKTVTLADAGVVCTPANDDTSSWSLSGNTLILDGDTYTVSSYTCNSMTITMAGTTNGELNTVTFTKL